jgi:hypothetical protein
MFLANPTDDGDNNVAWPMVVELIPEPHELYRSKQ